MKIKAVTLAILTAALPVSAVVSDSVNVTAVRELRPVEVLGIKQMPSPSASPITIINRATVNRLGIYAIKDIGEIVPNFYTPAYGSRMTSSIYVRGLGSRLDQAVVGLNIDGVPFLNKDAYDSDIPDIASIEVARGAQSLLNGRNSMGGQINIYTLSPRDFQGFRASVEYGRANTSRVSAGGYFRVADGLFTSIVADVRHTDGFWRNEYNGSKTGLENSGSLRWKTVFSPSAHHTITNTTAFSLSRQSGYPYQSVETGKIAYNDTCFYRRNAFSDGLTVAWAGKRVVVTSLTSVQYLDDNMTLDQDFLPEDFFTLTQRRHEWTFTEDLFAKGRRNAYSWLGGVFAFARNMHMWAPVTFYEAGISSLIEGKRNEMNPSYPIEWDSRNFPLLSEFTTRGGGFALYHQSQLDLGDWTLEAGLRWDFERVTCNYNSDADAAYTVYHVLPDGSREFYKNVPVAIHDNGRLKQTFNELLPKVAVSYRFPAGKAFFSLSRGYKSGGFNTQMFSDVLQQRVMESMGVGMSYKVSDIVSYKPESSWNFELGVSGTAHNDRASYQAVAFLISCRDQQLTVFPPGMVTGRIMTNAGRTRSMGFELSGSWQPVDPLTFRLSYGFTNAVFRNYDNGREDFRGKRVPYAPAHTLFASTLWQMPFKVGGLTPSVSLNVRGVGDIQWNEANTVSQPFYALLGAELGLRAERWSIQLWGRNITSTRYNTFYFLSMGNSFTQRGIPATFGATLRLQIR